MISESQLREIEAREQKTTKGPWAVDWKLRSGNDGGKHGYFEITAKKTMFWICKVLGFSTGDGIEEFRANAEFIAASRADIPALTNSLREAAGIIERFDAAIPNYTAAREWLRMWRGEGEQTERCPDCKGQRIVEVWRGAGDKVKEDCPHRSGVGTIAKEKV